MAESGPQAQPKQRIVGRFGQHLVRMPRWHQGAMGLAVALMIVGVAAQAYRYIIRKPAPEASAQTRSAPEGSRTAISADEAAPPEAKSDSWSDRLPKWATRIGAGFVFGFIIGWVFRAFIKTMALVTVLGVGILFGLSYFNVIDFQSTRKSFESRMGWVTDQGERLKNVATTYVPSSVPALLGGFLGFRRKMGIPGV